MSECVCVCVCVRHQLALRPRIPHCAITREGADATLCAAASIGTGAAVALIDVVFAMLACVALRTLAFVGLRWGWLDDFVNLKNVLLFFWVFNFVLARSLRFICLVCLH